MWTGPKLSSRAIRAPLSTSQETVGSTYQLEHPSSIRADEELRRLELPLDLGRATEAWDWIWTEIKSA